ncbi:MAG: plasmid mobilization relaxosome protein MobC [Acidisphaera sp.]|nr:plasmid mobilization relaxosome protein MobC [Acidisphaera sp.]
MSEKRPVPWKGRPRANDPRNAWIHVRCTQSEYATLSAAAERAGVWLGPYVLAQALSAPPRRSRPRPNADRVELGRVLGALGAIGGNVNQLARAYNSQGDLPEPPDLATIRADMSAMRAALMLALGREP